MGKIFGFLFGKKDKEGNPSLDSEPVKVKPKIPITGKLTYKGKSLSATKDIIHRQQAKSTEDFQARVDDATKWIDEHLIQHLINPLLLIPQTVHQLDKKEMLALRVALEKHPYSSSPIAWMFAVEIEKNLKISGHRYVLRKGKH